MSCQQLLFGLQNLWPPPQTISAPDGSKAAHIFPRGSGRSGTPEWRQRPEELMISMLVLCLFSPDSAVSPPRTTSNVELSFSKGHTSCSEQMTVCSASPSHVPIPGSFSLVRVFLPPPQVLLQTENGAHSAHWQPFIITSPTSLQVFFR